MNAALLAAYRRERAWRGRMPVYSARTALAYARSATKKRIFNTPPHTPQLIGVPGLGILKVQVRVDEYDALSEQDGVRFHWVSTCQGDAMFERAIRVGACLGRNLYSLGHWDRNKVCCVEFFREFSIEARQAAYRAQGLPQHAAYVAARESIKDECAYLGKVAGGFASRVGVVCELHSWSRDTMFQEESCWGLDGDSHAYVVEVIHHLAEAVIAQEWKKRYDCAGPRLLEDSAQYRRAIRAYNAALVVAGGDHAVADPVFVSAYRGD